MTRARVIEIAAFAALAWYAAGHWSYGLVAEVSGGRVFACVLLSVAVAGALSVVQHLGGLRVAALRVVCVFAGLGAGFVAIGLERGLLAPDRWGELADGLERGFTALGSVEWPYSGQEPWGGLVLLLAVPLVLTAAAGFSFWGNRGRPLGLVLLLALYGTAVVEHEFDGELGRGAALFVLVAAWLWLPQLPDRGWTTALGAAGAVLLACTAALPAAARYDDRDGWVDYESWNPFAARASTRFDWSHSYGPIDWPREGTTLMHVRSEDRHYWRLQTLDRFDGFRWVRAGLGRRRGPPLPRRVRRQWISQFRVTIRDLDTELFPVAGTALRISDADPLVGVSDDGTVEGIDESLDEGDSYGVFAYVPDPAPAQMRAAPPTTPGLIAFPNTAIHLPPPGTSALDANGYAGDTVAEAPPRPASSRAIARSPYARIQQLARTLARGEPTTYDVVRAVQRHLRTNYDYNEKPPSRRYPLASFLFEDRIGYCQQFSGAMALILRMLDIPARVAAGFTPGSYNRDTKEYRVRDLDAHSWVEVWFNGIGWVPFDPTPSVAPADSQSSADAPSASGGSGAGGELPDPRGADAGTASSDRAGDAGGAGGAGGTRDEGWIILALAAAMGAAGLAARRVLRRLRGRGEGAPEEAELVELRRALARLGEPVPPRLTLRELERRLDETAGPLAAPYVRLVRERRYASSGRGPDSAARRDLRRALARGRGVRARIAAFASLPPLAFRRG